ncbi:hypothetical protein [Smaragdicoccus niigatensis]|uniref:hypothetical protein n=1 Tax=Smaragdicoccus niigatensis TaxID=359359 RepID=UPI000375D2A3|nr:hypothetical protein [Smaragdicoccus niigatensis]
MNTKTLIATPLIGLAVIGAGIGAAGIASAGTLPTDGNTIAMTIYNDTDQTMTLTGDYTSSGDFIAAPQDTLAPHSSEIVTASVTDWDGFTAVVNYGVPNTNTIATFEANNTPQGASTDGTQVGGYFAHRYDLSSNIDSAFPNMNASFTIAPNGGLVY